MALHNSLHTGSAAHPVVSALDARLAMAGELALNGAGPLDVRCGILYAPGSPLNVTGDSSAGPWRVKVSAGTFVTSKGVMDGPHVGTNDGDTWVSTIAPPASNSRYDLVYVMQQDADATISPDGTTAPLFGIANGASSITPSVPATPSGATALATLLIASTATAGTSGAGVTINTAVSRYTTVRGAPIPVRGTSERAEITAYESLQVYRLDLHTIETYNGTAWGMASATVVGQTTVGVGPITNAADVVLATAPTVIGDGVKRFKITASFDTFTSTVSSDTFVLKLKADGVQIRSYLGAFPTGGWLDISVLVASHVPSAGSHTYTLTAIRNGGTGTGNALASATAPIEIIVEPIT